MHHVLMHYVRRLYTNLGAHVLWSADTVMVHSVMKTERMFVSMLLFLQGNAFSPGTKRTLPPQMRAGHFLALPFAPTIAMKKALIALAVLAVSGSAMAQSSVTVFGIVDMAVSNLQASGIGHKTGMSSGSQSAGRLGFRGTEDLGGGLAASFWLEGALQGDEGNAGGLLLQRRSTVSLSGNFGEVRLGRDFSPTYLNINGFDVFGQRGVGQFQGTGNFGYNDARNSNMVQYFLPSTLGGFYGNVAYSFGGATGVEPQSNLPNDKQGNSWGGRIGYANGPLNIAAAYTEWKQVIGASNVAPVTIGNDLKIANIAGTYDFGVVKLWGYYGQEKVDGGPSNNNTMNSTNIGITAPIGAGEIRASVNRYDLKNSSNDANKFNLGYGYNLSKRTQLYATVSAIRNKGAATRVVRDSDGLALTGTMTPGGKSSGFDLGIRHSF
jgi:predicted porin